MTQTLHFVDPVSPEIHETLSHMDESGLSDKIQIKAHNTSLTGPRSVSVGDNQIKVRDITEAVIGDGDIVVLDGTAKKGAAFAEKWRKAGAYIIDVAGVLRTDMDVPLYSGDADKVSEAALSAKSIRVPARAALQLFPVLKYLEEEAIKTLALTAMMPVSFNSVKARDELYSQTKNIFMNVDVRPQEFEKAIAFNLIPQVGNFMDDGATEEEWATRMDLKKILGREVEIVVNCIYAPVFVGQSLMVNLTCEKDLSASDFRKTLTSDRRLGIIDLNTDLDYVTPHETQGEDQIFVSRIREDIRDDPALSFWSVTDNLRLGALAIADCIKIFL